MSATHALWASTAGLTAMMVSIPLWGLLSDLIGRRPLMLGAALMCIVVPYPAFQLLLASGSLVQIFGIAVVAGILVGVFAGVGPAVMSELFPTSQRTTGISISFGLATAVLGGFAPFLSTWLIKATGSPLSPTFYVIAAAVVSSVMAFRLRETAFERLH
ncbi:Proline/betaine transporter [bioreactor metagenome]|uniref:Proline/betaine transporter n=1 Tax=bioreactor metagenome TaxID=1076179 RepID=A0A645BD22_9ZZZZ